MPGHVWESEPSAGSRDAQGDVCAAGVHGLPGTAASQWENGTKHAPLPYGGEGGERH